MLLHAPAMWKGRLGIQRTTRSATPLAGYAFNPLPSKRFILCCNGQEPTAATDRPTRSVPAPSGIEPRLSSAASSHPSTSSGTRSGPLPAGSQQPFPSTQPQPYQLKASSRALLERRREKQASRKASAECEAAATAAADAAQVHVQLAPDPAAGPLALEPTQAFFRFWYDEKRFKGTGADSLVQRALLAAGGRRTGGHVKSHPRHGPLGWQRLGAWEVLWSPSSTALMAASQGLRRDQLVCAVPGSQSLTRKRRLPETLTQAYGTAGAAALVPLSFQLPSQLAEWQRWMADHPSPPARGQRRRLWMLKTSQHLGKGLQLVPQERALDAVLRRQTQVLSYSKARQQQQPPPPPPGPRTGDARVKGDVIDGGGIEGRQAEATPGPTFPEVRRPDPNQPRPFVVAQLYIHNPLLIHRRKFGIRLWVVAVGVDPLRAYLHKNGLVLFATEPYDADAATALYDNCGGGGGDGVGDAFAGPLAAAGVRAPSAAGGEVEEEKEEEHEGDEAAAALEEQEEESGDGHEGVEQLGQLGQEHATLRSPPPPPPPSSASPAAPLGHVTNYAQNEDGQVWSLKQLRDHLGVEGFSLLYRRILRSAALTVAAALPHVRSETARLRLPADPQGVVGGGCFELFGLDYLVDEELRPWLLEVNATPSLAVQHNNPRVERLIRREKEGMVVDMLELLRLDRRYGNGRDGGGGGRTCRRRHLDQRSDGAAAAGADGSAAADGDGDEAEAERLREALMSSYPQVFYDPQLLDVLQAVEAELEAKGNFLPLMPLFPQPRQPPAEAPQLPPQPAVADADGAADGVDVGKEVRQYQVGLGGHGGDGCGALVGTASSPAPAGGPRASGYLLDAAKLPPGYGTGLPWSTADRLVRAWCRDRERLGVAARVGGEGLSGKNSVRRVGNPGGGGEPGDDRG